MDHNIRRIAISPAAAAVISNAANYAIARAPECGQSFASVSNAPAMENRLFAPMVHRVYNSMAERCRSRTSKENVEDTMIGFSNAGYECGRRVDVPADPISSIANFNRDAGNTIDRLNGRQSALYTGLQFEELAEKVEAVGLISLAKHLDTVATLFKRGDYDYQFDQALRDPARREAMLDADIDLVVVSVGGGVSQGADVAGALGEVCRANDAKRDEHGNINKDANGKIVKPAGWTAPDLSNFILK